MVQKLGVALVTAALVAVSLAAPAVALEPAADDVDALAPRPQMTDDDGDRLVPVTVEVPLSPDGRVLDLHGRDHGHGGLARAAGTAAFAGEPQMVILEDVPAGTHLAVRSRNAGTWSPWTEVVADPDEAPDAADPAGTPGVGPIWLGDATEQLEIALLEGEAAAVRVVALDTLDDLETATGWDGVVAHQSDDSTTTTTTTSSTTTTTVADDADSDSDESTDDRGDATLFADSSFIRPRGEWATSSMTWACDSPPREADELRALVVHHTAGTNDYTASDVPAIIRGIWYYHVQTRGWCDIAYNFVVDKYGGVWEARRGGITEAIIGGHTRGFNTGTSGVAQLGNYDTTATPSGLTTATRRIIGWKLGHHGIDPAAETTVTNRTGAEFRGVDDGDEVPVPTVIGHRDLGSTSCPGQHTYGTLPYLRAQSRTGVHVVALHETFLEALPTPSQYGTWLDTADEAGLRATAVGMARSAAYSGRIIDDLYERVLDRPADEEGKAYWLGILASGVRVEEVGAHFYGSEEYVDRAGSTRGYITALYENLLFRAPEDDGLTYWSDVLDVDETPPPQVARSFYASLESRRDRVDRLYDTILGRPPDPSGHTYWAEELLDTDDVLLAVELSLSDEFYERATR